MKKAIGTMILLAACAVPVVTPALAEDRDHRGFDSAYVAESHARDGWLDHRADARREQEIRREREQRERDTRLRNERFRHERQDWRERFDRDRR